MLTVAQNELIRRKVLVDGMSQRAVAQELGHSRKTVKKALEHAVPPGYRRHEPRSRPVLEPVRAIIEAWLEADRSRPRKQRHTAQRIYERLRDEHQFAGSYSPVQRFVAEWNRRQGLLTSEVFVPLVFAPGEEAQVDWGEATVLLGGHERTLQFFCVRFAFSRAVYVRAYERQDQISFLDAHVRAFEFFGGVPKRLAYDNLKTAVIRVGRGRERDLSQKFLELRSWYLFDTRFCNVASGNEKGHVENLVKRVQRTFLTPLPQQPFAACAEVTTRIDKFSTVRFDNCSYSVPVEHAYQPCVVRGYLDRIEILCEHECVATHARGTVAEQYVLEPGHYLPLLRRKPGLLHNGRPELANVGNGIRLAADYDALFTAQRQTASESPSPASRWALAPGQETVVDDLLVDDLLVEHREADAVPLAKTIASLIDALALCCSELKPNSDPLTQKEDAA